MKSIALFTLGRMCGRQGKWEEAEVYFEQGCNEATRGGRSFYRFHIGIVRMLQGDYNVAQKEFEDRLQDLATYRQVPHLFEYPEFALNAALSGNLTQCQGYMKTAQELFEHETYPPDRLVYLYKIAEVYRILREFESAKQNCHQAIEGFWAAEDAEDLLYLAEARLVMGKILVDMGDYREAIIYFNKAKAAFEHCGYYALGETLLYLGKAHQGLGGPVLLNQAKAYITNALAEFQRLELSLKEQDAREVLKTLS